MMTKTSKTKTENLITKKELNQVFLAFISNGIFMEL